ncbi:MAG: hisJ [Firmicutes bacterium]|nr:hisJ [Bacillota bacterium]
MYDTHTHTRFSTDSKMVIEDAVNRAREMDVGITITEHMDLAYPDPDAFVFDIDEYFRAYQPYRSDDVLLGIEIGMRSELTAENRKIVDGHAFDYVIGSIHVVDGIDIYQGSFYQGRTKQAVYGRYFQAMVDCLKTYDFIDSLGHIDYICRYARFTDPEIYFDEFKEYLEQVLGLVADKQIALEINTRRLGEQKSADLLVPIYRRFRELGGKYVTLGSDAHTPKDISKHFKLALAMAKECSLKPVRFKARKVEYLKEGI